ncbi:cbb3-type cytochrome oxidase subunit 3 [Aestuariibacter salexigens]|uniref:cbb3-type cytochrome oxidase subunit 3 n=1 Tax=Aestuariibacter salexigens TaxID=226010 RepID=UPI0003FDBCA5|nr:CcoQ/FixQ family Cbb3-type cytochrome c oxidase assembly chaperone [Aestuariibacter salexigens]
MDQGIIGSIFTVAVFVFFLGIVWWAFSKNNKEKFDEASKVLFDEQEKAQIEKEQKQESQKS